MWRQRVLATAIGIVLAGVLLAGVALLFMGRELVSWFRVPHSPVDLALEDPAIAPPCIGDDSVLLIHVGARSRPLSESRVEEKFESDRGSAFARYSSSLLGSRCLSVVLRSASVRVEAMFDTDYGRFSGEIQPKDSHVHLDGDELCFDLAVIRNESSPSLERWQGKIPIR
ncbi:MAG TPA: hypothetical protein VGR31_13940 [Planctomycetota bacterium]|jgi:hypothetical protein|nr:hypothetical protein [Planctomycetota bacterium]